MKAKLDNPNINWVKKRNLLVLIIGILLILAVFGFNIWRVAVVKKANKNVLYLDDIIVSSENTKDKANKKSYVFNTMVPYTFAAKDDEPLKKLCFIFDGDYYYVAYIYESQIISADEEALLKNPMRLEGVTKVPDDTIKKLAVDAYNKVMEKEEDKITLDKYDDLFGDVYLDATVDADSSVSGLQISLMAISGVAGIICLVYGLVLMIAFKKSISKLSENDILTLNSEMNSEDAFFYRKAKVYLTKKYIIDFNGNVKIIKYDDILWIYPWTLRTNGVKSQSAFIVYDKNAKQYKIAEMGVETKSSKEVQNEIYQTILEKNDKMTCGYTSENVTRMNKEIKEIKQKNKELKKMKSNKI